MFCSVTLLSIFFLSAAPIVCICGFILFITSSMLWHSFSKIHKPDAHIAVGGKVVFSTILALTAFVIALLPSAIVPNVYKLQLLFASLGFLSCYTLLKPHVANTDYTTFISFSVLSATNLMLSTNLINVFFTLELINMLVIYSFFLNSTSAKQIHVASSVKISASCVYQFILNFFSSIILYAAINWYISVTGGAELSNSGLLQVHDKVKYSASLILAAFLLKFGSGPWIFYKVSIYKSLNYAAVLMYTSIYLLIVFVFFLNLIFVNGIIPTSTSTHWMLLLSVIGALAFSSLAFQLPNLFVFLSFSSLINITVFLLQALSTKS